MRPENLIPIDDVLDLLKGICSDCQALVRKNVVLAQAFPSYRKKISIIVGEVAAEHNLSVPEILERGNSPACVTARRDVARRARKAGYSLPQIGNAIHRHHTTVINLLKGSNGNR